MLYLIIVLLVLVLIGVIALIAMLCAFRLELSAQLPILREMNEADKEIILGVDRIEDELGTSKPKKGA